MKKAQVYDNLEKGFRENKKTINDILTGVEQQIYRIAELEEKIVGVSKQLYDPSDDRHGYGSISALVPMDIEKQVADADIWALQTLIENIHEKFRSLYLQLEKALREKGTDYEEK